MIRSESGNASAFARFLDQINEVSEITENVLVCRDAFYQLSLFMKKIFLILREVQDCLRLRISSVYIFIQPIELEIKNAKELINICSSKSKFYLLILSGSYRQHIQETFRSLASSLVQISSANVDLDLKLKDKIKLLCKELQNVEVRLSEEENDLMIEIDGLSSGDCDDPKHSSELIRKMAMVTGVSTDPSSLRHEYEELKREKEMTLSNMRESDVIRLQRVIAVLSSANASGSEITHIARQYQEQRQSLDSDLISPLQTFYCPITQEVMENPVEIESGHTFEMAAIQRWFDEGYKVCPITKMELKNFSLRPNRLLKESIEEWKDINTVKKISKFVRKLSSDEDETIQKTLLEIQSVCEEKSIHKYWIATEGLIPLLVKLLGTSKREVRKQVLVTLSAITADNSENKVALCNAGAIEYVVRSLARDPGEARHAVTLLLELSKEESLRDKISKVQGSILLLVTITNSENTPTAANAKELLKLLANTNDNVILMANANYFKPLVQSLGEGLPATQVTMASNLANMQLSDQSRALLVQMGVLSPLIRMLTIGDIESKSSALGALKNLSTLSENRDPMIQGGVMQPLLDILFTVKSVAAIIKEHAAAIFANLAMSSQSLGIPDLWGAQKDTDEAILQLMTLINFAGPNTQSHVLRALFYICSHSASTTFRETLREGTCIQVLVRLINDKDTDVRLYALKLLFTLTRDGGDVLSKELTDDSYKTMVNLFSSDSLEEEKAAAMGILGNLPLHNRDVTQKMLETGVLSSIISILEKSCSRTSGRSNTQLVENASWALVRFTLPTDIQLQLYAAKSNVILTLVNLLGFGTPVTKCRAAMSLQQLSESTPKLCKPFRSSQGWFSCFMPQQGLGCTLHKGPCSVNETFCLLEAEAISPLIQALEDKDEEVDDAVLGALITIVADEYWEKGADIIVEHDGVRPIIRKLTIGNSSVQEKALLILEKILRKESYKLQFGSIAQMPLVSLTQEGTSITRPLAAKILAHLNILHEQSTYF